MAELCNLDKPVEIEGTSLVPVLNNPMATVKNAACTQHPRPAYYKGDPEVMGRSVRTERYRYTEWREFKSGTLVATELYDHRNDPMESVNVAAEPSRKNVVKHCQDLYRETFGKQR